MAVSPNEDKMIKRNTQAMKMLGLKEDELFSFEDYKIAADSHMKSNPRITDSNMARYLEALKNVFEFLGLKEGSKISLKASVELARNNVTNPEFVRKAKALFSAVFDNLDVNGNGFLSAEEWEGFMASLKFKEPSKSKEIFEAMDLKQKDQLSREEFVEMSFEYWYSGKNEFGSDKMFGNQ